MRNKNKIIVLISGVLVILLMVVSVSFAIFRFGTDSTNQELVLGDIWMKYEESNEISLENALPGDEYTNYFEFTITGTNTYTKKDIYYDISLTHGDIPAGKEVSNRVEDKYLKFKLTEVNGDIETEIFTDKTYNDLTNKRVHVDTISKSTSTYSKTYRLYMVISEELTYGNSSDAILSTEEFGKIFGSVKVNVTGDFNEKELAIEVTDESCFETYETAFYTRNENMTEEELTLCANFFMDKNLYGAFTDLEVARNFCNGTGKIAMCTNNYCQASFEDMLARGGYLDPVNEFSNEDFTYFVNNNIVNKESGVIITEYDETCGSDVVIPSKINNNNVLRLNGFYDKGLTSVVIPSGVRAIESDAFAYNSIKKVIIPSSVFYINYNAFLGNLISDLTIEDGVEIIGTDAFSNNQLTSVTFPNSIRSCYYSAFDGDVIINNSSLTCDLEDPLYSPWNA